MKSFLEWTSAQQEWKMPKDEIIARWNSLPPNAPLVQLRAVPPDHTGPTYQYDGMRVTGSRTWIEFVMSRMKDVLQYEGGKTRLQVVYKQQVDAKTDAPIPQSFVFYLQVREREAKGVDVPKITV